MPPSKTPPDLSDLISNLFSRVRALENGRRMPDRPVFFTDDCLNFFGNGWPDDPYRIGINMDPDVDNQIECRETGLFVGGGQSVGWDALVDGTVVASDPENRLFKEIGEALSYLQATVGLTSCAVFVRPNAGGAAYTETADFTSPQYVHLYGGRGSDGNDAATSATFQWDVGAFGASNVDPNILIENCAEFRAAAWTSQRWGSFTAINTWFELIIGTGLFCQYFWALGCTMDMSGNGTFNLTAARATFIQTEVVLRNISGGTHTFVPCAESGHNNETLIMRGGCRLIAASGSGTTNMTLPTYVDIEFSGAPTLDGSRWDSNGTQSGLTLTAPSGCQGFIHAISMGGANQFTLTASSAVGELTVKGRYSNITFSAGGTLNLDVACNTLTVGNPPTGEPPSIIRAMVEGNVDVGHAHIDITQVGTRTITLRSNVTGFINTRANNPASGTLLSFVAATYAHIVCAFNEVNATGTAKPYDFDASSQDCILIMSDTVSWPVAGTDSGTNNIVFPEDFATSAATAPSSADYLVGTAQAGLSAEIVVGTTPGGELGGTWASPTVDTTHSGSSHAGVISTHEGAADPHTGYQKESEKDAANGYLGIGASIIQAPFKFYPVEDDGTTQTAAGFYAGTGAPNNANGANGDFYFRSDGGALTTIYHKRVGAWVGII